MTLPDIIRAHFGLSETPGDLASLNLRDDFGADSLDFMEVDDGYLRSTT